MGALARLMPLTYTLYGVGSFALCGFPFLSGYYSKEGILETLYSRGDWFAYFCTLGAAFLTAYYSFRVAYLVFGGLPRGDRTVYARVQEGDFLSLGVVLVLGVAALLHGWLTKDLFVGWGTTRGWSTPVVLAEFATPGWVRLLPLVLSVGAAFLSWTLTGGTLRVTPPWGVYAFLAKRWWWDYLDSTAARRFLRKGYLLYVNLERGLHEWVGPSGLYRVAGRTYDYARVGGWFPVYFAAAAFAVALCGWCGLTVEPGVPVALAFTLRDRQ